MGVKVFMKMEVKPLGEKKTKVSFKDFEVIY